jgi:hypothetical protein
MQSLLDLVRGCSPLRQLDELEFDSLLKAAEQENVVPWTAERLRAAEFTFTPAQEKRLKEIHREVQLSAFVWSETLKNTLIAFHRAGLSVIALKGPSLAERLYGDASLRTCYDLDLLVRRLDFASACQTLSNLGFSPNGRADDYHQPWSRKGLNLELHHNVENPQAFDFDVDTAWNRTSRSEFHGAPVWLFTPADELLYLCLHGVRHRFERLCQILDLALAFRRLPFPTSNAPTSVTSVLDNMLALGWMMAAHLDPEIAAPKLMRVSQRELNRLERLADGLWDGLMSDPSAVLDWSAQHRFFLELETPGWHRISRRWRHRRILAARLINDDYVFAERFSMHRDWQVRLLRPVRLLIKHCHLSLRMQ